MDYANFEKRYQKYHELGDFQIGQKFCWYYHHAKNSGQKWKLNNHPKNLIVMKAMDGTYLHAKFQLKTRKKYYAFKTLNAFVLIKK